MIKIKKIFLFLAFLCISSYCFSMVYDNRFLPLFKRPYSKKVEAASRLGTLFFAMGANKAMGRHDNIIEIPAIFGEYNQKNLGQALVLCGCKNPLRDELQNINLPWCIDGTIKAQGVSLVYDQSISKYVYVGGSLLFMSIHSLYHFMFDKAGSGLFPTHRELSDIYEARCIMHNMIGIQEPNFHQIGFGDVDLYLRIGNIWDFLYKFRRIDAGFTIGALLATGLCRNIDIPASIPFGGNGHYGIYISADAEFELKEDMKLGFLARINKRFSKTCMHRLPVCGEHFLFGALRTPIKVDPGATFIFAPYFSWEHLRQGLGFGVGYTLVYHSCDTWEDCRSIEQRKAIPADIAWANTLSGWGYDFVTVSAFYDFGSVKTERNLEPIIYLSWDIPSLILVGFDVPKTNRVSLGLEVNF